MRRQAITAVYENGMFIPTTKVDLPEHTTVKVSIPSVVSRIKTSGSLECIFDLAPGCKDTDLSTRHDEYLYGDNPL